MASLLDPLDRAVGTLDVFGRRVVGSLGLLGMLAVGFLGVYLLRNGGGFWNGLALLALGGLFLRLALRAFRPRPGTR